MIRLYCATGNPGKLREFQLAAGLAPVSIELVPGFRELPPAVEDGATFEENAVRKALHYSRYVSDPLFADDSGLEVDALAGAPGVLSARFAGPQATDQDNNRLLLEKLRGLPGSAFPFTARFVCRIALLEGGRVAGVFSGKVEGLILEAARGQGGFGYDPLFFYPPFGCTFGEAGAGRKFQVSHRGQALRALLASLL
ncbi:MAG TPA: non-canonical purine NTP pyrophosphatase [Bryobacteraceae bacterium]|nr:non-canonical purine NTP pyrophosphatase [Bryobacteraceae bacterium]